MLQAEKPEKLGGILDIVDDVRDIPKDIHDMYTRFMTFSTMLKT